MVSNFRSWYITLPFVLSTKDIVIKIPNNGKIIKVKNTRQFHRRAMFVVPVVAKRYRVMLCDIMIKMVMVMIV